MTEKEFRSFIIQVLRRGTYKWRPRSEAKKRARVGRNQYKCAGCGGIFGNKEVDIDHKIPVIDEVVGFTTWGDYIQRLFCPVENFQILCRDNCHSKKTKKENKLRSVRRKYIDKKENK